MVNEYVDNTQQSPSILSLCTGMRKLEDGFSGAIGRDVETVSYVEREAFVIENLVRQMEQGVVAPAPVWTDVKTFDATFFFNRIDGILASYPCQPFSRIGRQSGVDDPRHLWPHIARIIRDTGYPYFLGFENVVEHARIGFDEVYTSLHDMGYKAEAGIFSAEESGLDQIRERFFILAIRKDMGSAYCKRLQGHTGNGEGETGWKEPIGSATKASVPLARQGQSQLQHEPSRVIGKLGHVVNGYNFREDLLRMAGNGVVQQTAELAFRTLIQKFI